jgi:hypothetical protein
MKYRFCRRPNLLLPAPHSQPHDKVVCSVINMPMHDELGDYSADLWFHGITATFWQKTTPPKNYSTFAQ